MLKHSKNTPYFKYHNHSIEPVLARQAISKSQFFSATPRATITSLLTMWRGCGAKSRAVSSARETLLSGDSLVRLRFAIVRISVFRVLSKLIKLDWTELYSGPAPYIHQHSSPFSQSLLSSAVHYSRILTAISPKRS